MLIIVILGSVGALAFMLRPQSPGTVTKQSSTVGADESGITLEELAKHTGRDGNSCWVAVDNTVYEISGSYNGQMVYTRHQVVKPDVAKI